jgi:hypothetical protein
MEKIEMSIASDTVNIARNLFILSLLSFEKCG